MQRRRWRWRWYTQAASGKQTALVLMQALPGNSPQRERAAKSSARQRPAITVRARSCTVALFFLSLRGISLLLGVRESRVPECVYRIARSYLPTAIYIKRRFDASAAAVAAVYGLPGGGNHPKTRRTSAFMHALGPPPPAAAASSQRPFVPPRVHCPRRWNISRVRIAAATAALFYSACLFSRATTPPSLDRLLSLYFCVIFIFFFIPLKTLFFVNIVVNLIKISIFSTKPKFVLYIFIKSTLLNPGSRVILHAWDFRILVVYFTQFFLLRFWFYLNFMKIVLKPYSRLTKTLILF